MFPLEDSRAFVFLFRGFRGDQCVWEAAFGVDGVGVAASVLVGGEFAHLGGSWVWGLGDV